MLSRKFIRIVGVLLVTMLSFSCVTTKDLRYMQQGKHLSSPQSVQNESYRLKPRDMVYFIVLTSHEESKMLFTEGSEMSSMQPQNIASMGYMIYDDQMITIPFAGDVAIGGLTLIEAQAEIERQLKEFIPDVQVKLSLVNDRFYVYGEAGVGEFPLKKDKITIFEALSLSGDISKMGDRKKVRVMRPLADGTYVVKTFDIRSTNILESEYYYIYPNDIIYVPELPSSFFRITSFTSFISLIMVPVSWLLLVINLK